MTVSELQQALATGSPQEAETPILVALQENDTDDSIWYHIDSVDSGNMGCPRLIHISRVVME